MKHLLLDIGNVLVNQDMEPFLKKLSIQMNLSKEDSLHFLNRIQKKQDLGLTCIADEVITHFNIKSEYIVEDILNAWYSTVVPNRVALDFFNTLANDYQLKVAIVSNLGFEHMAHFKKVLRNSIFTESIHHFSCEVGARKPSSLYYHLLLKLHPEFEGAVYVDDLDENLKTGSDLGLYPFKLNLNDYLNDNRSFLPVRLAELRKIFDT